MRAGDANGSLGVSAIFQSKRLNNDEPSSASSPLVTSADQQSGAFAAARSHTVKPSSHRSQPHLSFPPSQRTDGCGLDEIRFLNFGLNIALHSSGWALVAMGDARVMGIGLLAGAQGSVLARIMGTPSRKIHCKSGYVRRQNILAWRFTETPYNS